MSDDWRAETRVRLTGSAIYNLLKKRCQDDAGGASLLSTVDDIIYYAYHRTKAILRHMGEFTLHDGDHLFRVLHLMDHLLPEKLREKLSVPELALLVASAFFHDIGMAPREIDVMSWKGIWEKKANVDAGACPVELNRFRRFCDARPDALKEVNRLHMRGEHLAAELLKGSLVSGYIRVTHAVRAKEVISKDWAGKFKYRDADLTVEFAEICYSHNEDALNLLDLEMDRLCGVGVNACLPLVGVVLRMADILDFDAKRTPEILLSHLWVRNPVSLTEWNKHRAVEAWSIGPDLVQYHARCEHPAIEASIHEFCDLIDLELSVSNNVLAAINSSASGVRRGLAMVMPLRVDRSKVITKKDMFRNPIYKYRRTQFTLSKRQVTELLMGTKLYGDPAVALRELLQNSIDACLLRAAQENKWGNIYVPSIEVKYHRESGGDFLEVVDNGTGMDEHIVDNYYSRVGSSFYKSAEFYELKAASGASFTPTSRFGIGILSCFMVADSVEVDTRRVYGPHKSSESLNLVIEGQDSVFWIRAGTRESPGTSTKLYLKKDLNPWRDLAASDFVKAVEQVVPNPPFKIIIQRDSKQSERNEKSFLSKSANDLRNYNWQHHSNIREVEFKFSDSAFGFVGSAIVGILEAKAVPKTGVEVRSRSILIEGSNYELDKALEMQENTISMRGTSITIDDDGAVDSSSSTNTLAKSEAKLSFHGIEVPNSIFPDPWRITGNQAVLKWPFPMLLVIDICGKGDLDLNSARTQILRGQKWSKFEEQLAYVICQKVAENVSVQYWHRLRKLLAESGAQRPAFIAGLMKVETAKRVAKRKLANPLKVKR